MELATIGYERSSLDGVIGKLTDASVKRVIDVRAVASSRRAGFSKTLLRNSLAEAGIDYVHLRALGTPKAGREAARKGRVAEMHTIYHEHLSGEEPRRELAEARAIAKEKKSALLCYEDDAATCHRRIVADILEADGQFTVEDL